MRYTKLEYLKKNNYRDEVIGAIIGITTRYRIMYGIGSVNT